MIRCIFIELKQHPLRYLGSVSGFASGVVLFSVCSVLIYHNNHGLWRTLSGTGTHFIAYTPRCCEVPYIDDRDNQGFFAAGIPTNPFKRSMEAAVTRMASVKDAVAVIQFRIRTEEGYLTLTGLPLRPTIAVDTNACSASDIIAGRYFTEADQDAVVLDSSFAEAHDYRPGMTIALPDRDYRIIGIVHTGVKPLRTDIFMPYRVLEKRIDHYTRFTMAGLANVILVESASAMVHPKAVEEVRKLMGEKGIVSSYGCHKPSSKALTTNTHLMTILLAVNLLFLVLHTIRSHATSIKERRRTFGILYSLGWSRKRLVTMTVMEGCIITAFGSLVGLSVSAVLVFFSAEVLTLIDKSAMSQIPAWTIVLRSFGYTLAAGVVAGVLPGLTFLRRVPLRVIHGA